MSRHNIYGEELTDEVALITKTTPAGRTFYGLRFYLKSPPELHHGPDDDDRSAVTIWTPWTEEGGHDHQLVGSLLSNLMREHSRVVMRDAEARQQARAEVEARQQQHSRA
jgi:hypothetical protein